LLFSFVTLWRSRISWSKETTRETSNWGVMGTYSGNALVGPLLGPCWALVRPLLGPCWALVGHQLAEKHVRLIVVSSCKVSRWCFEVVHSLGIVIFFTPQCPIL
jgi:hypothetical protein